MGARPVVPVGARVIMLASGPPPQGVTSNIGHPSDPAVVELVLAEPDPIVVVSEGSGHLGAGGAFWLADILTEAGQLRPSWQSAFTRAGALWLVPLLGRLAAGEAVSEESVVDAYRTRHGASPVITT